MIDLTRRAARPPARAPLTLAAAAVAAASVGGGGCIVHGRARGLAYVADGAMILSGGALLHSSKEGCDPSNPYSICQPSFEVPTAHLMGVTLLALGAIGLGLQLSNDLEPSRAYVAPEEPALIAPDGDDVVVLTRDAKAAAHAGACPDVQALAKRVFARAPGYYERVFLPDREIATCLEL